MAFVMKYREKFAGRLESFRVIINNHHAELQAKEQKWIDESSVSVWESRVLINGNYFSYVVI